MPKQPDAATTAAGLLLGVLQDWGVDTIFGLAGDGINGILGELAKRQDAIRFVGVRHEEAAAFMACAWAKWTGKLGVCLATSGPGGLHLLNGLYDAKMDKQPVLAITGMPFHDLISTYTQQDVELDKVFDNACVYNARVMGPTHVENVADLACRHALGYRGVAHIAFPISFQSMPVEGQKRSERNVPFHESSVPGEGARIPTGAALKRAADVLNAGKRVFLLAGSGAKGATDSLLRAADALAAPIGKALLGKCVVPDDSAFTTGTIGYLDTDASQVAMDSCDTLLLVGSSFPYIEYLPKPAQARCVQIDTDPARIGLRFPAEVGLIGDARATLEALLPLLERKDDRSFLAQAQQNMERWKDALRAEANHPGRPMKPQTVAAELGKRLAPDAIVTSDSGTCAVWWARYLPAQSGQMHSVSGLMGSMACGLPYANAAALAYPGRQVVGLIGDGGFSMIMGEFITAVRYRLPIKIVVLNNQSLAYIRWEQMLFQGDPEFGIEIPPVDYAAFARACGGAGFRIEAPEEAADILDQAFATDGPVVIDAIVDPYEPVTPPKLSQEQKEHYQEALDRGQPHRGEIEQSSLGRKARAGAAAA